MNLDFASTLFAQAQQTAPQTTKGPASIWPMLLAVLAIFYFFIIRPQQKKQKETKNMLNELAKGDRVVTIGGIMGTVVNIKEKKDAKTDDDIIVLKVSDTSKIEMIRSSIARVLPKESEAEETKN
jgi:preprotein translocase subunit YajC